MIVVDSNILFSALLSGNSLILDSLLNEDYKFVAPTFIFSKIFKHKEKIVKHSKLTDDELLELLNHLYQESNSFPIILFRFQFTPQPLIYVKTLMKRILFL